MLGRIGSKTLAQASAREGRKRGIPSTGYTSGAACYFAGTVGSSKWRWRESFGKSDEFGRKALKALGFSVCFCTPGEAAVNGARPASTPGHGAGAREALVISAVVARVP